jgi:eukaryotic-like serine/threonine-protein kinase
MAEELEPLNHQPHGIDPWIGRTVGNYRLKERLGEGGMGVVYLADDLSLNRLAAIKFLYTHMVNDREYLGRFIREARAAATLNHPHLIVIYDAGVVEDEAYFYSMEYVGGGSLGILVQKSGPLGERDAALYIREAASGLAYAHKKGIIHRDVKPDNLMLTEKNIVKVGDLGLAKWTGDGTLVDTTPSGQTIGTPFYMSPEQVRGARHVDPRSDIYSLGSTLYYLLIGNPPYLGPSAVVIMSMHLKSPVPDPRAVKPDLDADLCAIIRKMMAKNPDERYQSMEAVDAALVTYLHRPPAPA